MRIVQVTDVIHAGGAETFVLRLAQALHEQGHDVRIFVFYKNKIDRKIAKTMAPDVPIVPASFPFFRLFQLVDELFLKMNIDLSFLNYFFSKQLRRYLRDNKIEIVHGHLFTADYISLEACRTEGVPVVATMHGDYSLYHRKHRKGTHIRIVNYPQKLNEVVRGLKEIVCISNEQLEFFKNELQVKGLRLHKIYNGYSVNKKHRQLSRSIIGIDEKDFLYGMVARGIPEKGWEEVIRCFLLLDNPNASLLLVGASEYVQQLKEKYLQEPKIFFAGYSSNPIEYIELFDAGLFASTYFAESLPTVVIEYLGCDIPVVCTDIAECANMLATESGSAGIMVPLDEGRVNEKAFAQAMRQLQEDQQLYKKLRCATRVAYQKFDMQGCVTQYEAIYKRYGVAGGED